MVEVAKQLSPDLRAQMVDSWAKDRFRRKRDSELNLAESADAAPPGGRRDRACRVLTDRPRSIAASSIPVLRGRYRPSG